MNRMFCCFKGGNPNQLQPPQNPSDPEEPFGDNEYLNYLWRHKIQLPDDRRPQGSRSSSQPPLLYCGATFRWAEIVDGTENFRRTNVLGEGNFGVVYRCDFPAHNAVGAAKIQKLTNPYAHPEFAAEITTLYRANHPNVIKLLGKCFGRKDGAAVVYELMPKGSLDSHLFARPRTASLDWERRMRIAIGVAEALVYLHNVLKVIHRDVKASNVLLDEGFVPKLTDFGLATRIVEEDGVEREHGLTPSMGTPGYVAPETEKYGLVSTKSDVHCYGVFLFELFTGRKALDKERPPETMKITDWLLPLWNSPNREENIPLVIDVALGSRFYVQGLERLFDAAWMCVGQEALARPDMNFMEQIVREAAAYPVKDLTRRVSI